MNNQYEHLIKRYFFRFIEEKLNPLGLSGPMGFYLLEIDKRQIMKMNQLVDLTPYHKSHSTRIVTKLHDMNLVNKVVDPEDLRGFVLSITDFGREMADKVRIAHHDWDKLESKALSKTEALMLNNLMEKTYLYLKNHFDEDKK